MSLDYILRHNQGDNCPLATNDLLTDLSERMKAENKELSDYGLPEPENVKTELELERMKYDPAFQAQLLRQLNESTPNNPEQVEIFNYIATALDNIKQNPFQSKYYGPYTIKNKVSDLDYIIYTPRSLNNSAT
jgi:hypothetical protein